MSKILFVKNLSGSFIDQHIGHEVINNYVDDNFNAYFYIPPYGCIGEEKKGFFKSNIYNEINLILVFDDVNITNIFKLKQVIFEPKKFKSFEEMKDKVSKISYSKKTLDNIDFGDNDYINLNNKDLIPDLVNEKMKVYLASYILDKNKVYDFENDNIFIYVKSSGTRNNLKEKSLKDFKIIYGNEAKIYDIDIVIGQRQYAYKCLDNLENWFNIYIQPLCLPERKMDYKKVPTNFVSKYEYDDNNFLSFVKKSNDENYYTNYINGILNSNIELLNNFFSFLVKNLYHDKEYVPQKPKCMIQVQSMTDDMKLINKIIRYRLEHSEEETLIHLSKELKKLKKKYNYTDEMIERFISNKLSNNELIHLLFIDGQMDLYLEDENYRIVIENKILSGLNGKHDEISEEINQLVTYNRFINHLDNIKKKNNNVVILCPYCLKNDFINYKILEKAVPIITYRDLSDFFENNKKLIIECYRDDFIKTVNKQALTKEELITYRFIKTIQS